MYESQMYLSMVVFFCLGSCHVETSRVRVLEEHSEGRAVRGRPNGGPERAGLEAAEPQTRRRALLHTHAARTGVCEGRKLPPGQPLQRSMPGGQTSHHTGGFILVSLWCSGRFQNFGICYAYRLQTE